MKYFNPFTAAAAAMFSSTTTSITTGNYTYVNPKPRGGFKQNRRIALKLRAKRKHKVKL